jgi:TPR repeat protein/S1-C subfamily serine protease
LHRKETQILDFSHKDTVKKARVSAFAMGPAGLLVEITMNRSLVILFPVFLAFALFAPAWGETDVERCTKAYEAKDYKSAYPACLKAAEEGIALAQFLMGGIYYYGLGVREDYAEAGKWFSRAAEQGIAGGQYFLGRLYYEGQGVPKIYTEAVKWYRKAAEQGYAPAQSDLGGMYDTGQGVRQDYAEAVKWYRKATEQGDANAQFKLGSCYERGDGVKRDYSEALRLYRAAAKQGHMKAEHNLGVMYANGTGVEKDYKEAIKWYQMAAATGDSSAQSALGYMYVNGYGVPKDQIQALMYWEISSAQGNTAAMSNKKHLLKEMSQTQIAKAQNMAKAWLTKHGLPADNIGLVDNSPSHDTGAGVREETTTVEGPRISLADFYVNLLQKGADYGDPDSQYELAERYIRGEGVEKNRHLAEKWLIHSIINDPENQKSIKLIEKEFGWHCINSDMVRGEKRGCSHLINKTSIKHDKYLSWYWSLSIGKTKYHEDTFPVIIRNYNVMNCNNRTEGIKAIQAMDYDFHVAKDFTTKDNEIEFKPLEPDIYSDRLFNYVCGPTDVDKKAEDVQEVSFGTGWPIQPGYIVTNQHVVSGKKKIAVVSNSGEKISAAVLIEDRINDLALLQVNHPEKLPPALPIAKLSAKIGSKVFTIGYPHPDIMGTKPKLTEGIVNALSGYMDDPRILQISVPVQSGNSGGPLLNMSGEVIGIVTAKLSAVKMFNWTGDLPQNVNYAVKSTYIAALLDSVKKIAPAIGNLPAVPANLESLSSRIQNSVFMIIAE